MFLKSRWFRGVSDFVSACGCRLWSSTGDGWLKLAPEAPPSIQPSKLASLPRRCSTPVVRVIGLPLDATYGCFAELSALREVAPGPVANNLALRKPNRWDTFTVGVHPQMVAFSVFLSGREDGGNRVWQLCWCMRGLSSGSWIHTSHPLIVPLVHASLIWLPACLLSLWISGLLHISSRLCLYIIHAGLVGSISWRGLYGLDVNTCSRAPCVWTRGQK